MSSPGKQTRGRNNTGRSESYDESLLSPDLLARILEIADDAIISVDTHEAIRVFNQGAEKIFGYSPGEVLGRPLSILVPERFRARHSAHVASFAKSPTPSRVMAQRSDIFGLRKDGTEFPAEASISYATVQGMQLLTVILRDITERKDTEQRLKSTIAEREVLLREVHHRVKNNLQVVTSLLNLQARATQDEYVQRAFEESQHRVQSMALIHEQLYGSNDFSAIDFPDYILQLSSRLFRSYQIPAGRVELETRVSDVALGVDEAVPCGLILNELLSNSLKYAFDGSPGKIYIHVDRLEDASIRLTIGDNGRGLPPEVGFWNTKTLGLRLVRSLVRQLDGEIEVGGPPGVEYRIRFSPESEA